MLKNAWFMMALLLANVCQAALVDFEEVPIGLASAPIESQGFRFSSGFWEIAVLDEYAYAGTRDLKLQFYSSMLIDRTDGDTFSLSSVIASIGAAGSIPADDAIATGYFSDGSSISVNMSSLDWTLASLTYNDVNSPYLRMYHFSQEWTGLSSVRITPTQSSGGAYQFDNFVLTAVPLPAAAWLYGSCCTVLVWLRRRQHA